MTNIKENNTENLGTARAPRRVVSMVDAAGKSRIEMDGSAPAPLQVAGPGSALFYNLWGTRVQDAFPRAANSLDPVATFTEMTQIFPPLGGSQLTVSIWPPQFPTEETLPLWMHSTDTVDYILILAGEITCFFDSGEKVTLLAGDCLVQNGTAHAWRNEGTTNCIMAAVAVGASRT